MILMFSTNTIRESVAYRSFSHSRIEARGVRKVTTGINELKNVPVRSQQFVVLTKSFIHSWLVDLLSLTVAFGKAPHMVDRNSVVRGRTEPVRVDLGGGVTFKKKRNR